MLMAVKAKDTRNRHLTLLDLAAKYTMPQNMVYAWTQILRYAIHLSVARTIQSFDIEITCS